MTTATFTPPNPPVLPSKEDVKYRLRVCGFGDGYIQRAPDGINTVDLTWNLTFVDTPYNIGLIKSFMDSMLGATPFYYTQPGDIQRKYTCGGYANAQSQGQADSLVVTLTMVYDP